MDALATLLVIPLVYGLFLVLRGIWRLFTSGSPAGGGGSRAGGQPWTPYQSPGAPMGPGPGFGTGLIVGHWLGEHHHEHDMDRGFGSGGADDGDGFEDADFGDDD